MGTGGSMTSPINERDLENLDIKVQALHQDVREGFARVNSKQDVQNGRLSKLELRNSYISGAVAVLSMLFAVPAFVAAILGVIYAIRDLS